MKRTVALVLSALCSLVMAKTVKVSEFKPVREDSTKAIQDALDSGASTVIFDHPGFPYLVAPLNLRSNQELVFQDGVEVRAIKGIFKGTNDNLFKGELVENVVMRGEGKAILAMNKKDYWNKNEYQPAEWRHTISLLSTRNVRVANLTILASGGDGVYVSDSNKLDHVGCKDTIIEDCIIDDHHRQGISVIAAENLTIRRCVLSNTRGTAPQCGIDFEPNHSAEKFLNCVVEDCVFTKNAMAGILVHCPGQITPIDITFRNCTVKDNPIAMHCTSNNKAELFPKGRIVFDNVTFENNKGQFIIRNQRVDGPQIIFKDCLVKIPADKNQTVFACSTDFPEDFGNVICDNLRIVRTDKKEPFLTFSNPRGSGLQFCPGTITWGNDEVNQNNTVDIKALNDAFPRNPDLANFKVEKPNFKGLKPVSDTPVPQNPFTLRSGDIICYQYVQAGKPIDIDFKVFFRREDKHNIDCNVVDTANETKIAGFNFGTPDYKWHFEPTTTTVLRLEFNTHGKSFKAISNNPGFGFGAYPEFKGFRCTGDLYFQVPADLEEVRIMVMGDDNEAVQISVYDAAGTKLATTPYSSSSKLLKLPRKASAQPEMWKVKVDRCVEDYTIRIQAPVLPIFYSNPANALVK